MPCKRQLIDRLMFLYVDTAGESSAELLVAVRMPAGKDEVKSSDLAHDIGVCAEQAAVAARPHMPGIRRKLACPTAFRRKCHQVLNAVVREADVAVVAPKVRLRAKQVPAGCDEVSRGN